MQSEIIWFPSSGVSRPFFEFIANFVDLLFVMMDEDNNNIQAEHYYNDAFFENPWQALEEQLHEKSNLTNPEIDMNVVMAHWSDAFFEDPWKDLLESPPNMDSSPSHHQSEPHNFHRRGKPYHFQQRGRGGRGKSRGQWHKKY